MIFNFKTISSIFFPQKCLSCFLYTKNQELLCNDCLQKLTIHNDFVCIKCYKPINVFKNEHCHGIEDFKINSLLYCLDYRNKIVKEIIHQFKYQRLLALQTTFKLILKQSLKSYKTFFKKHDYILIPVPLSIQRKRTRGFNQADVIAKLISKILNIPYYPNILIRYKNNSPQANIENQIQRSQNVKNIFKLNSKKLKFLKNKNIILVDDVFTTGSTLNECAKILKQNKVKNILVICLAH